MSLELSDWLKLIHPLMAVVCVFPLIGISVYFGLQNRERRRLISNGEKSAIPAIVGLEHVKVGKWLTTAVLLVALEGMIHPTIKKIISSNLWNTDPWRVMLVGLVFLITFGSLVLLHRARADQQGWRAGWAVLTIMGTFAIGFQGEIKALNFSGWGVLGAIYRRDEEWFFSHFYFGMVITGLMIVSLAIIPEIYQDRSQKWRNTHVLLNFLALLLLICQGLTGVRDLLEIPLNWQAPAIYRCDFVRKNCDNLLKPSSSNSRDDSKNNSA